MTFTALCELRVLRGAKNFTLKRKNISFKRLINFDSFNLAATEFSHGFSCNRQSIF